MWAQLAEAGRLCTSIPLNYFGLKIDPIKLIKYKMSISFSAF